VFEELVDNADHLDRLAQPLDPRLQATDPALVEGLRSSNRDFADTVEDFYNNLDLRKHREHFLQDLKGKGLLALLAVLFMAWTASKTVGGGGQQGGH
jgi:hypothetical protein